MTKRRNYRGRETKIRFPSSLYDKLSEAADEREVSVNYLVTKAVEEFLPRLIPVHELKVTILPKVVLIKENND